MKTRKRLREEARKIEQKYMDDEHLYDLIFATKWESMLSLLAFKTRQHETVLRALISERQFSPLWIILFENNFLSDSAKALCLRLIEIGGKEIVYRTGREEQESFDGEDGVPVSPGVLTNITALHCACRNVWWAHEQIDNDANENNNGNENLLEVIDKLVEVGGEEYIFMKDSDGQTAWQIVCQFETGQNDVNIVRRLLEAGGEKILFSISQDEHKYTALHRACLIYQIKSCKCKSPDIVHFLIDHGGEKLVFMTDSFGRTPLDHACSSGGEFGLEIISRLLKIGGKKLALMTDKWKRSSLEMVFDGNVKRIEEVVGLLIEVGGKDLVNSTNIQGHSALHMLFNLQKGAPFDWRKREDIWLRLVRKLLEVGGEKLLMLRNVCNRTAVHFLCRNGFYGNSKILQELIKVGGEKILKQEDVNGNTALHFVCDICNEQSPEMVNDIIVAGGAEVVFLQNVDGFTPLHVACKKSGSSPYRLEVINQLLEAGRQRLLFHPCEDTTFDGEPVTAMQIEGWDPCQEVIDRLIEVGGERAANLIRG
jgi:ankyrin repeat protein